MLDFIDKKFNSNKTPKYKLSIQISLDGFLFGIFDSNDICLVAKEFSLAENTIDSLFVTEPILTQRFDVVNCIVVNQKSTLVPNSFFEKNKSSAYLKFACNNIDGDEIFVNKIKKINACCIFAIDRNVCKTIRKYHPQTEFYNQSIPLINAALSSKGKNMFVFFDTKIIDIVVTKNENLLLQNSYKIETVSDAMYFAAAVREQLKIEVNNIYLSGKTCKSDEEKFSIFFKQTKLETNAELALAVNAENALRLLIFEKLNKCV